MSRAFGFFPDRPQEALDPARERKETLPIIGALIFAIAPHVPGLPLWINLWCMTMWGYMLIRLKTGWPLPSALLRYLLTITGITGLLLTYRLRIGADAFIGLMALMAALKPFEMPTHRHQMITILLTYFIIITSLFRSETLFTVVYMVFSVLVTTTALVRINAPSVSFSQSRKLAGAILARALPLVAVLFMVFPRLPDSLFGFKDPTRGKTGFSEILSPGQVSSLALDETPAFRVSFQGPFPPADQLYWRGMVFHEFDGRSWRPGPFQPAPPADSTPVPQARDVTHTVMLAPHNSRWLPVLDRPVQGPAWAALGDDLRLRSRKKITKKTSYTAVSVPGGNASPAGPSGAEPDAGDLNRLPESDLSKAVPEIVSGGGSKNPRALKLAEAIADAGGTAREKADRILAYFRDNGFVYTLEAPQTRFRPLDTFMFETKKGYCEHYASAFAFMLNNAGVPARVVGGYLGGELNPFGDYLIVRQSYAHAWVEFFDTTRGWVRSDPTSAVAPERLYTNPDGTSPLESQAAMPLISRLRFALDAVNLGWESWFTGYSHLEQQAWLKAMGLIRAGSQAAPALSLLTALGIAGFLILLGMRSRKTATRSDPVARSMEQFYAKLEKINLAPQPGQGPVNFKKHCMGKRPDLAREIQTILDLYLSLRYKRGGSGTARAELREEIRRFKPSGIKERH